jgi:hypothetical protein
MNLTEKLRRNLPNIALLLATILVTAGVAYSSWVTLRSLKMYRHLKTPSRGWQGHLFRDDPELGFTHIPGARGFITFPAGPSLPVVIDNDGFRVPEGEPADSNAKARPLVLSLGCSVTFGDACLAQDAFTYRTAQLLGGRSINAGVCSYGLEQMLPRARTLIPRYKPDYVLVQFSGWLVARAMTAYAPAYYGRVPVPFYTRDDGDSLTLHPRLFSQKIFDLPLWEYRSGSMGLFNFISFLGRAGGPLFLHDDFNLLAVQVRDIWSKFRHGHALLADEGLMREVIDHTYTEIAQICSENGARMIIVKLGGDENGRKTFRPPAVPDAIYVDAEAELVRRLPDTSRATYRQAYGHWRGNPPVLVDEHPNPAAHSIIAEEIVKAIENYATGDTTCHLK